jgi:hypothetical protein
VDSRRLAGDSDAEERRGTTSLQPQRILASRRQIVDATSLQPMRPQGARRYAPIFFELDFEVRLLGFMDT